MNILFFMPDFAHIPISSLILLGISVFLFAFPFKGQIASVFALVPTAAAVTLALMADGDKSLLAGAILLSLALGLALRERRCRS